MARIKSIYSILFSSLTSYCMAQSRRWTKCSRYWATYRCVHYLLKMPSITHSQFMADHVRYRSVQVQRLKKYFGWPNWRKRQPILNQSRMFSWRWAHWKIAVSEASSIRSIISMRFIAKILFCHYIGSSEEGLETCGLNSASPTPLSQQRASTNASKSTIGTVTTIASSAAAAAAAATASVRSNNAIHVCWHRGATVGLKDFIVSSENQLSGYLLRKFKNSSGWQKLWVVFTSFCLFFYKNYQDEFALASLPLLGWV